MLRSFEKNACPTLLYFSFVFPEDLKKGSFTGQKIFPFMYCMYSMYIHYIVLCITPRKNIVKYTVYRRSIHLPTRKRGREKKAHTIYRSLVITLGNGGSVALLSPIPTIPPSTLSPIYVHYTVSQLFFINYCSAG